jgi:hypothetical protein
MPAANVIGNVWITGCEPDANGNYGVYQFQGGSTWVPIPDPSSGATQIGGVQLSVSPDLGVPWLYKADGSLYR